MINIYLYLIRAGAYYLSIGGSSLIGGPEQCFLVTLAYHLLFLLPTFICVTNEKKKKKSKHKKKLRRHCFSFFFFVQSVNVFCSCCLYKSNASTFQQENLLKIAAKHRFIYLWNDRTCL